MSRVGCTWTSRARGQAGRPDRAAARAARRRAAGGADPLAHPVDRRAELRRGGGAGGDDLERRAGAGLGLGRRPPGPRIRPHPGAARKRDRTPAQSDPPLHQPAEPGPVRRDPAAARGGAGHADQPRRQGPDAVGLGRGAGAHHRPLPQRLRRAAQRAGHHRQDLRGSGAGPGQGHGGPLLHHRRRHRPSRRADLALARKIPRGLHRDAGGGQFLLSVAADGRGRRRPPQHRDDREDHSCHDRSRRQRSAAHGAAAARDPHRRAARGLCQAVRAAREPHRAIAQHHRRQPGRGDRRHRRPLDQDAPARAEGTGDLRPHAGGYFPAGAVDRGDLPRHHPHRRRDDRAVDPAAAAADHDRDARDHARRP